MKFKNGIAVCTEDGQEVVESKVKAAKVISQVVGSRFVMAAPGMLVLPVIMERLERQSWLVRNQSLNAPFQTVACGGILTAMIPIACSLFNQNCSVKTSTLASLEPLAYDKVKESFQDVPKSLYFNKGL